MVGSGTFLQVEGLITSIPLHVQKELIKFSAYVLPISSADIILGAAWLATLGPHIADYSSATIKFYLDEKFITLTGEKSGSPSQAQFHHFKRLSATDTIPEAYTIHCLSMDTTTNDTLQLADMVPHDLATVLHGFASVFAVPTGLPPSRTKDHCIVLHEGVNAVKVRSYRYPVSQKAQIETMVADMLREGLIQPSTSPFSAPVLLVRKKDGTWHFCTDYRALNAVTIKDSFPMPTVNELLDELHGSHYFSKLDLRSGYHQILLKPEDRYKTPFRTHHGLYEWLVMPFGLTNAPATFQALMNDVFLTGAGVEMDPGKVTVVSNWQIPTSVSQLRAFLGLTAPVLVLMDFSKPFIVETDASGQGIGAILSQNGHPIAFFSKKLSYRMQQASTYVRELYAITEAVAKFRHYLFGHYFIIRTDHHSLRHISDQTIQTPEQQALLPKLLGYNFRIEYKAGTSNGGADGLSRCFNFALSTSQASIVEEIQAALAASPSMSSLISKVEKDPVALSSYQVKNGFLYRKNRMVIPPESKDPINKLLVEFHSSTLGGHAGFLRTYARIATYFFWQGMRRDIHNYIRSCQICQRAKTSQLHPAGLLSPLPIPNQVWEDVAMDFIIGLPNSHGYTIIMVVIDSPKAWVNFLPWAEFWYNSAGVTPFKVVYGRDPPSVITRSFCDDTPHDVIDQLQQRDALLAQLKINLGRAQARMKKYADKKRRELSFAIGDYVFVKLQPYRQHSVKLQRNQKLGMRYFGPFRVVKQIGLVAYKLELPATSRIHPVFHVSFLKPCVGEPSNQYIPLPLLSTPEGPLVQPIHILDSRKVRVKDEWEIQVLVQWDGREEHTWESWNQLQQQYPNIDLEDKVSFDGGRNAILSRLNKGVKEQIVPMM
ncbi:ty3-gypsy retrotransposon protein [Tanacetum coccineum]